jgi:nucleoside-diphosphate-sugar epimerase
MARILVAGASGVVGQAAVAAFAEAGWDVIAVSRRPPDLPRGPNWRHVVLDLLDAEACRSVAREIGSVTHVVYAALYEKPGLVAGWRDEAQMATNLAMLQNLLTPLRDKGALAHVGLLQGTKAYGVHIRPFPSPAKESWPRHPHRNFYWLQEDWVRDELAPSGIGFTIFRPQVIFGDATGVAMNIIPVLATYGSLCREEGRAFGYPGGPDYLLEAVDARLLADALLWAADAPSARNETFNIANGDVFCWRHVWLVIADTLGLEPGPDTPLKLGEWLPQQEAIWQRIVARHDLRPGTLAALLGESHHYADFTMATGATRPPQPALVSTIKLRQAGFSACIDTEQMFRELLASLAEKRIVPMPGPA